jgi:hypothetical protein
MHGNIKVLFSCKFTDLFFSFPELEMGRISTNIKEGAKVSVLGSVVGENVARPLLGELWKTKRLFATVLRVAPGNNRWIICPESQTEIEIEVSAGRMKFVDSPISADTDQNISNEGETRSETDISSDTDSDSVEDEAAIRNANNNTLWINKIITIDPRQVSHSYSSSPVVHIADISNATPRLFFERFMPIDFIMSVVIPATNRCARECERGWNDLTWAEFMKFIGILTIMTYVKCADIRDYWSIKQETAGVSLAFDQYMAHQRF